MSSKVLNFKSGHIDNLPDWFQIPEIGLKVICGPGDYVHFDSSLGRFLTNVEKYIDYDVFVCLGDEGNHNERMHTSVDENEQYLIDNNYNKLICLIDIFNEEQMNNFTELFGNKVIHINRQDGHCPIFKMEDSSKLLKPGGKVHIKFAFSNIQPRYPPFSLSEKKQKALNKFQHDEFICDFTDFTEPTTERLYPDSLVCTKRNYGNNLVGGRKRKMRTKKRKHLKRRRHTRRRV